MEFKPLPDPYQLVPIQPRRDPSKAVPKPDPDWLTRPDQCPECFAYGEPLLRLRHFRSCSQWYPTPGDGLPAEKKGWRHP